MAVFEPRMDHKGQEIPPPQTATFRPEIIELIQELIDRVGPVFEETTDPTANDDSIDTSGKGRAYKWSKWENKTTKEVWICIDDTPGAAVWRSTGSPSQENPSGILYINGDADTDGSRRFIFTSGDDDAHIELRANGVWNDTGFRVASASIDLGRDLRVSAVGGFIETQNISEVAGHLKAAIPHIQFDTTGTPDAAHMPVFDEREDFVVYVGPATGEILGTTIGQTFSATPTRVLHSVTHTVGSIGATAEIQVSYHKGSDNTGPLLNRFRLPASSMVAGQPLIIVYEDDFGFENSETIFFEFQSANNISLATNAAGKVITTQNGHNFDEVDILLDNMTINREAGLTLDREGNFVVGRYF